MMSTLISTLKRQEGLRLKPYKCPAGKITIGYGRNLEDVGITEKEAETLLRHDIETALKECRNNFAWFDDMSQGRQEALVNMCFQMGINKLAGLGKYKGKGFKNMLSALEDGRWEKAYHEALNSKWAKQTPNRAHEVAEQLLDG